MASLADTSFLFAVYFRQVTSPRAAAWLESSNTTLRITALAKFEFFQAARQEIFIRRTGGHRGFTMEAVLGAFGAFEADQEFHAVEVVPCDYDAVLTIAEDLSDQHTIHEGQRAFDILHVASALHVGASDFLTFDQAQRRLAQAAGLVVPNV